jgi:hypothetical protein
MYNLVDVRYSKTKCPTISTSAISQKHIMLKTFPLMILVTSSAVEALPGLSPPLTRKPPEMPGSKVLLYVLQLEVLIPFSFWSRRDIIQIHTLQSSTLLDAKL